MKIYGKTSGTLYIQNQRAIYAPSPDANMEAFISEATAMAWEQRAPVLSGIIKPEDALRYELLTDAAATAALKAATTSDNLPRTKGISLTPNILDTTQESFRRRIGQEMLESVQQQHAAYYNPAPTPAMAAPQPAWNQQPPVLPAASPANPKSFVIGPWSKGK